jgi:hypothetical protein
VIKAAAGGAGAGAGIANSADAFFTPASLRGSESAEQAAKAVVPATTARRRRTRTFFTGSA